MLFITIRNEGHETVKLDEGQIIGYLKFYEYSNMIENAIQGTKHENRIQKPMTKQHKQRYKNTHHI